MLKSLISLPSDTENTSGNLKRFKRIFSTLWRNILLIHVVDNSIWIKFQFLFQFLFSFLILIFHYVYHILFYL